ncbi:MAG: S8 family serine peptidase [Campylobacterales bacterium]|nr:S8 family serine peptidase [Campylobacterales bacterium]
MKSRYLTGLILSGMISAPLFADISDAMKSLIGTIKTPSQSKPEQTPPKSHARVIAVLKAGEIKETFLQSLETNAAKFKIKKSFYLAPSKSISESSASGKSASKQLLVIESSTLSVDQLIEAVKKMPGVESVTEDQIVHACEVPNDPKFNELWGLQNNHDPITDINVTSAWDRTTGSEDVVIGIIDTGVDYTHSDLSGNIWINPDETPNNGVDDDGNGYIDDVHGIDTVNGDSNPMDDNGHGTHTAGTIGAVGDNETGIAGVNWNVKIVPCKFLDASGLGYTSDAIECVNYFNKLKQNGTNIVATNNSWGSEGESDPSLQEAIQTADSENILFIAAAGNGGDDYKGDNNDITQFYPANYDIANIVSVAASDTNGNLASFSNYGATTVDLAAPGVDIVSTIPTTATPNNAPVYFSDNFENGTNNWVFYTYDSTDSNKTDITTEHWTLDNSMSASSTHSLSDSLDGNYTNNRVQLALLRNTIDLSNAVSTANQGVCVNMKIKGEIEEDYDYLALYLSKNDSQTWDHITKISGQISPDWKIVSLIIPSDYFVSNLQIAIARTNDSSVAYEGYNMDDVNISSCSIANNYAYGDGTSMATPHVTGALGLLASIDNGLNASQRKQILLDNITLKSAYNGKVSTSGLLNAGKMIASVDQSSDEPGGGGGGGGCTYNPNNEKFDALFVLMLVLSIFYPWRRKFIN